MDKMRLAFVSDVVATDDDVDAREHSSEEESDDWIAVVVGTLSVAHELVLGLQSLSDSTVAPQRIVWCTEEEEGSDGEEKHSDDEDGVTLQRVQTLQIALQSVEGEQVIVFVCEERQDAVFELVGQLKGKKRIRLVSFSLPVSLKVLEERSALPQARIFKACCSGQVSIRAGSTLLCGEDEDERVSSVFSQLGSVIFVRREQEFDKLACVNACSALFVFNMCQTAIEWLKREGVDADISTEFIGNWIFAVGLTVFETSRSGDISDLVRSVSRGEHGNLMKNQLQLGSGREVEALDQALAAVKGHVATPLKIARASASNLIGLSSSSSTSAASPLVSSSSSFAATASSTNAAVPSSQNTPAVIRNVSQNITRAGSNTLQGATLRRVKDKMGGRSVQLTLYLVKGKSRIRVVSADPTAASVRSGDAFIAESDTHIISLYTKGASKHKVACAVDTVKKIVRKRGVASPATLKTIDMGEGDDALPFFALFGLTEVPDLQPSVDDAAWEAELESKSSLYRVTSELKLEKLDGKLSRQMLQTDCNYIYDSPTEMHAWQGRKTDAFSRSECLRVAQHLLEERIRDNLTADWVHVQRQVEGAESALFESKFHSWPDSMAKVVGKAGGASNVSTATQQQLPKVKAMLEAVPRVIAPVTKDTSGTLEFFLVKDFKRAPMPAGSAEQQVFFSNNAYVICYKYQLGIIFW
jgi:pyrroline-5-carboxylate reductase